MENPGTFPRLETARLQLRRIQMDDLHVLAGYCSNRKISDQIINIPHPYTLDDAVARMNFVMDGFKQQQRYVFAIALKSSGELIGEIGLHLDKANNSAQFGYWIGEPFWGQGMATEALAAVLGFGFGVLRLNKIYATHYPDNEASGRVMQKNGMVLEARLKEHYLVDGVYRDVLQYRLTAGEFGRH